MINPVAILSELFISMNLNEEYNKKHKYGTLSIGRFYKLYGTFSSKPTPPIPTAPFRALARKG